MEKKETVKVGEDTYEIDFVGSTINVTSNYFYYVNGEKMIFTKSSIGDSVRSRKDDRFRKFSYPMADVMKKFPKQVWTKLEDLASSVDEQHVEPGASFFTFTEEELQERKSFENSRGNPNAAADDCPTCKKS